MKTLIKWLIRFLEGLEGTQPFQCGGTTRIVFKGGGRKSWIECRQPTGEEILDYAHTNLEADKANLETLKQEDTAMRDIQKICREKKLIPFALKIITGFGGYADKDGKEINYPNFNLMKVFFPHHLDTVSYRMYEVDETYEKKN